ncbi:MULTISPECIES: hypothetical protein [Brucella]|jgi:hypothetical protein|uniref:hypothetical protein n=1 Tax=Brucella TaxID=234 RepID=UPI001FCB4831|nr:MULTISPECIES: hypothetical protein [Brucella]
MALVGFPDVSTRFILPVFYWQNETNGGSFRTEFDVAHNAGNRIFRSCAGTTQKMWLDRVARPYLALSTALLPSRQRSFFTKRLTIGRTLATQSRDCGIQTIEVRDSQKHV